MVLRYSINHTFSAIPCRQSDSGHPRNGMSDAGMPFGDNTLHETESNQHNSTVT
jgi:hypothetical protein